MRFGTFTGSHNFMLGIAVLQKFRRERLRFPKLLKRGLEVPDEYTCSNASAILGFPDPWLSRQFESTRTG